MAKNKHRRNKCPVNEKHIVKSIGKVAPFMQKSIESKVAFKPKDILVACKIMNGFVISIGTHEVKLNGPERMPETHEVLPGSYGLTMVNSDFWEAWVKDKQDFAPVKNKSIFASEKENSLDAMGKEYSKIMTGMEKKDPSYFDQKQEPLMGMRI